MRPFVPLGIKRHKSKKAHAFGIRSLENSLSKSEQITAALNQ